MSAPTEDEVRAWLENALCNAECDAQARPHDNAWCAAKAREAEIVRAVLEAWRSRQARDS